MTPYNGNASTVAGLTQVTVSNPQDGDTFNAANDVARTNTLADFAQRLLAFILNLFSTANTWTLLQTFSAGVSAAGPNTLTGTTTVAQATPTTISSFSNSYASGSISPRYWKDSMGVVHLDGLVMRATAATLVAFTLPSGFRPTAQRGFAAAENATGLSTVNVNADGTTIVQVVNNGESVDLAGITFSTF